jgi:hypothetical protein
VGVCNISLFGKLFWCSLGMVLLKDGNGECFWYVVFGRLKTIQIISNIIITTTFTQTNIIIYTILSIKRHTK